MRATFQKQKIAQKLYRTLGYIYVSNNRNNNKFLLLGDSIYIFLIQLVVVSVVNSPTRHNIINSNAKSEKKNQKKKLLNISTQNIKKIHHQIDI